jgi:hypothetical protein
MAGSTGCGKPRRLSIPAKNVQSYDAMTHHVIISQARRDC